MPKLRHLRIINAQFNDGRNIYEDFRMPFYGYNATFELVNGGGKSVLLMLLMQCILPKSSLTPERPFKDMFLGGDENRTTHVLAEWELEKSISDKKYLLTGFCAKRKIAHEDDSHSGEIQSFNYIYNYGKENEFDIHTIPLCHHNKNEFIVKDYSKTWSLLKEKGPEFNIRITDKKREYQEWLKSYNLLESEWNLIREINKREHYLKTHFANYKSSRTLIQDLLIRTIEECLKDRESLNYENKGDDSFAIADALFNSQESLKKLQEEQDLLFNYDKLLSEVNNLNKENDRLLISFNNYMLAKQNAAAQYNAYETAIQKTEIEIERVLEDLNRTESSYKDLTRNIERNELTIFNVRVNQAKKDVEKFEQEIIPLENAINEQKHHLNFSRAVNKYILLKERKASILENEKILSNKKEDRRDLFDKINPLGKTLHNRISKEVIQLTERRDLENVSSKKIQKEIEAVTKNIGATESQLNGKEKEIGAIHEEISKLSRQWGELTQKQSTYPQISSGLFIDDKIQAVTQHLGQLQQESVELSNLINLSRDQLHEQSLEEVRFKNTISNESNDIKRLETELTQYSQEKEKIQKIVESYGQKEIESCFSHLDNEMSTFNKQLIDQKNKINSLIEELQIIQQYGFSLNNDFVKSFEIMRDRYPQSISGAEYLKELQEDKRGEVLELIPWLPKTILLLDQYFKEIVHDPYTLPVEVQNTSPILASIDILRLNRPISLGEVFIPHRTSEFSKDVLTKDKTIARLNKDIAKMGMDITQIEVSLRDFSRDLIAIRSFSDRYPPNIEYEKNTELSTHKELKVGYGKKLGTIIEEIKKIQASLKNYQLSVEKDAEQKSAFENNLILLQELKKNETETQKRQKYLEDSTLEKQNLETSLRQLNQEIERLRIEFQDQNESLRQTNELLNKLKMELRDYQAFSEVDAEILSETREIDEIRSEYRAAKRVFDEMEGSVSEIESTIASDRLLIEGYTYDIQLLGIMIDELIRENPETSMSEEYIQQLLEKIKILESQCDEVRELLKKANDSHHLLNLEFVQKIKHYLSSTNEEYTPNPNILDIDPFSDELSNNKKERSIVEGQIESLKRVHQEKEQEKIQFQQKFTEFRVLDAAHHFKNSMYAAATQFIDPPVIEEELKKSLQSVKKSKEKYEIAKETAIQNISDIPIATEFKDIIKWKLKVSESIQEAEFNKKQLDQYSTIIHSKIEIHHKTLEALQEVEAKIVNQALGIAIIYRDYLKEFQQMSKLDIDGKGKIIEMVKINFDECTYPDDRAQMEMRRYIQDLNKGIRDGSIKRPDLQKSFRPEQLVGRVIEMGKIQVKIRKIEEESQIFQKWDSIKASDGQENTMYIIFLIALMSYIRNIVVGRYDKNTSKVLLLDNPFGSTGAFYLWEPIWAILKRNNIQLICSGHKIGSKIREFFPVHHILTEDISQSGLRRVNIKVEATGEARDTLDRYQRKTILHFLEPS